MTMVNKKHRKESFESLMRRFKKSCERSDVVNEVRAREHFIKPSIKRKRAREVAVKNEQRRRDEGDLRKRIR
jgi:small subunit ribosomal protein S21|tara:strand:+ start:372 stop:587 length:216 start_codon:yes stop_codon:yes gene_type:complete